MINFKPKIPAMLGALAVLPLVLLMQSCWNTPLRLQMVRNGL